MALLVDGNGNGMPHGPSCLQVETACDGIYIEHLTCKIKTFMLLTLLRLLW